MRLKDTDPYVAICFSFGNDLKTYCYGKDIEETKKALHYAIFFSSYELSDRLIGVDLRPIEKCATRQEKYALAKKLIKEAYSRNTPPYNDARKLPKTRTHTGCTVTRGSSGWNSNLKKKNQHGSTCRTWRYSTDSKLHAAKLAERTPTSINYSPPNRMRNTKKGCLGLSRATRLVN